MEAKLINKTMVNTMCRKLSKLTKIRALDDIFFDDEDDPQYVDCTYVAEELISDILPIMRQVYIEIDRLPDWFDNASQLGVLIDGEYTIARDCSSDVRTIRNVRAALLRSKGHLLTSARRDALGKKLDQLFWDLVEYEDQTDPADKWMDDDWVETWEAKSDAVAQMAQDYADNYAQALGDELVIEGLEADANGIGYIVHSHTPDGHHFPLTTRDFSNYEGPQGERVDLPDEVNTKLEHMRNVAEGREY